MKDFRERVVQSPTKISEVTDLLHSGQLVKALRKARAAGLTISQANIDATAKAMFDKGRAGELLSIIDTLDVRIPYNVEALLIRAFEARDYHTFLKQTHRLRAAAHLEPQIEEAISVVERRAPKEAAAWRRKFSAF